MFEYFNETQVFDGLTERVRAYMRTYDLDLDDVAVLLHSEPQHIADWLIGAAPRPQSVHTLLFSLGTAPNARRASKAPSAYGRSTQVARGDRRAAAKQQQ